MGHTAWFSTDKAVRAPLNTALVAGRSRQRGRRGKALSGVRSLDAATTLLGSMSRAENLIIENVPLLVRRGEDGVENGRITTGACEGV